MTRGSHSQSEHLCDQCDASFFTKEGLEKHFQDNMEYTVNPVQLIQQYKKSRIYLGKKNLN